MRSHPSDELLVESKARVTERLGPDGQGVALDELGGRNSRLFGVVKSMSVLLGAPVVRGSSPVSPTCSGSAPERTGGCSCLALSDRPRFLLPPGPPLLFS